MNGNILVKLRNDLKPEKQSLFVGEKPDETAIVEVVENRYQNIDKESYPRFNCMEPSLLDLTCNIREGDILLIESEKCLFDVTDFYKTKCKLFEEKSGIKMEAPEKVYSVSIHNVIC